MSQTILYSYPQVYKSYFFNYSILNLSFIQLQTSFMPSGIYIFLFVKEIPFRNIHESSCLILIRSFRFVTRSLCISRFLHAISHILTFLFLQLSAYPSIFDFLWLSNSLIFFDFLFSMPKATFFRYSYRSQFTSFYAL